MAFSGSSCRPMLLSVTTRGIGLNLCSFYADAIKNLRNPNELPNINAVYRAMLAIIETKLFNLGFPLRNLDHVYDSSHIFVIQKSIQRGCFWIPVILKRIIDAIGSITTEDEGAYFPVMSKNTEISGTSKFVPRPENIVLSNLQKTVEALADSDDSETAVSHRTKFYNNNPIPAAEWDVQRKVLMNAETIMPPLYNYDSDLQEDLKSLQAFQSLSNWFTIDKVSVENATENFSILMSRQMNGLRAPDLRPGESLTDYYRHADPENDVHTFYSIVKLSKVEEMQGATMLLGELPVIDDCPQQSIYALRSKALNPFVYTQSYKQSCFKQLKKQYSNN